jgi:hypothetical protein
LAKPQKQKLHKMLEEKSAAAKAEFQRLLDAGCIREVKYPTWLANVAMVKKKNGKWRMCTNFMNLNKYYPKDNFPLSRIKKVVDLAAGYEMMALLDVSLATIRFGCVKRMKKKQVSLCPSKCTTTYECPKA